MLPRPPISTLFPYTTLFRSAPSAHSLSGRTAGTSPFRERRGHGAFAVALLESRAGRKDPPRDRKSTRLNSSHVAISYAVFCLKKKNKTNLPAHSGIKPVRP